MTGDREAAAERALVERLRRRDEVAFSTLVEALHPVLVRVARGHVQSWAVAEDVAQATWLGVLSGIDRFEGRSSLRTWIFRILVNTARTVRARESRSLSTCTAPARCHQLEDGEGVTTRSAPSVASPEERLLAAEMLAAIGAAVEALPQRQRTVIALRDLVGAGSSEVCQLLGVSAGSQRVLLHRARARVRETLLERANQASGEAA